ncbi:MAG: DNA-directed RNA polymerase subunit B'' [Candidatus Micrarchaeales archaeon]
MSNELIDSYTTSTALLQHQIESFNRFLDFGLQKIVDKQSSIEPNVEGFSLKLGKIRLDKPSIIEADSSRRNVLPNEARLRNLTYAAPMFLEFVPVVRGIEKPASYGEVFVGELPVMLRSSICHIKTMTRSQLQENGEDPEDPGGYFIIKGTERVLIGLEDLAPNRIMTTKEKGNSEVVSKVFSTAAGFRARCVVTRDTHGNLTVNFPTAPKPINFILMLRALGLTAKEMMEIVSDIQAVKNDILLNIEVNEASDVGPTEAALEIGKLAAPGQAKEYQQKRAETQIDTYLLPHLGTDPAARKEKARYLIEMAKKASLVSNKYVKQDDKDHYANKRVKFAGELMEELFAYAFRFFVKDVKYQIERTSARGRKMTIQTIISPDTLTEKINYAMGTGTWVAGQTGVSQVLDRTNLISTYTHLRRIKSPLAKKHPHFRARDVHGTQWGKICPSETPEGQEVGLTKYLAVMARVTVGADEKLTEQKLRDIGKIEEI